jgi:1-deoxy-D-xylulose-5-phosphate reductoisomerase
LAAGPDQIDVIVHPQSVIHSMVEMIDGSITRPAWCNGYASRYPVRTDLAVTADRQPYRHSIWLHCNRLEFFAPDFERFPCLRLAYEALRAGGTLPAVLNAANEVAVSAFLNEKSLLDASQS